MFYVDKSLMKFDNIRQNLKLMNSIFVEPARQYYDNDSVGQERKNM